MTTTRKAPEEPDHRESTISVHRRARKATRVLAGLVFVAPFVLVPFVLVPFVLVPLGSRALVDHLAHGAANHLHHLLDGAFETRSPNENQDPGSADDLRLGLDLPYVPGIEILRSADPVETSAGLGGLKAGRPSLSRPRGGIFVRASVVANAVRSGSRPSGVLVPASGLRPAGLVLSGVSAFGSGLRDGDVLTQVSGAPATSVGFVVGAVAGALRKHAPVITAEVWRGDQRLALAVEIPPMGVVSPATPKRSPRSPNDR